MIFEKQINGVDFTLFCSNWKTRNSWGHEVHFFRGNNQIGVVRVRYFNRTWESYEYRTALRLVIMEAVNRAKALAREAFKRLNGDKIITKKRAAEFSAYLNQDKEYQMFNELYNMF